MLEESGVDAGLIRTAETLKAAREALRITPADVVLLDPNLPDSSGIETVEAVVSAAPDAAIVVMSGVADAAVALRALEIGAQDYLIKGTIDSDRLSRAIRYARGRRIARRRLLESEASYRRLYEQSTTINVVVSEEGVIRDANEQFCSLVGVERATLRGVAFGQFCAGNGCRCEPQAGEAPEVELSLRNTAGGVSRVLFARGRIDGEGVLLTGIDVTSRRLAEEERERAREEMQRSRDALQRLLRAGAAVSRALSEEATLAIIANAVADSGWARVLVHSYDGSWGITGVRAVGMSDAELSFLNENRTSPEDRSSKFGAARQAFRISRSFFIPAERLHELNLPGSGLPTPVAADHRTEWKKDDIFYVPMYDSAGRVIGRINLDAPADGRRPTEETIRYLESFAALAAVQLERTRLEQRRTVAEAELRRSESRHRFLAEQAADLITQHDPSGVATYVSPACRKLLGYEPQDLLSRDPFSLIHAADAEAVRGAREALFESDKSVTVRYRVRRKDGGWVWFETSAVATHDMHGRVSEIVCVSRDISDQVAAETALRESDERMRQAQKMEAVGQLAGGVAHDFNNLLTAIQGYLALARGTLPRDHAAVEALDHVEEAARQATGVANALLTFTRRSTGERRPVKLASVVETGMRLLRRTLPASVRVVTKIEDEDLWVEADGTQIQQVVMNLAINARDAMPQGGTLTVTIGRAPEPPPDRAGDFALLSVSDTGAGMTDDVLARIFEPFFTTKPRGQGTGLGLPIVHSIVTQHGGAVQVASRPGEGAAFRVFLPRCQPPAAMGELAPTPELSGRTGGRAVVVEDNQLVRGLMSAMLTALGFRTTQCTDGASARSAAAEGPVDLFVVDVELPDESGVDLLGWLRAGSPELKAVVVSGDPGSAPAGLEDARTVILQKPFQAGDMRARSSGCSATNRKERHHERTRDGCPGRRSRPCAAELCAVAGQDAVDSGRGRGGHDR